MPTRTPSLQSAKGRFCTVGAMFYETSVAECILLARYLAKASSACKRVDFSHLLHSLFPSSSEDSRMSTGNKPEEVVPPIALRTPSMVRVAPSHKSMLSRSARDAKCRLAFCFRSRSSSSEAEGRDLFQRPFPGDRPDMCLGRLSGRGKISLQVGMLASPDASFQSCGRRDFS